MRRVVLVLATTGLAILLAGGVAQAIKEPAIINGEPDRGAQRPPLRGGTGERARFRRVQRAMHPRVLGHPHLPQGLPYRRACTAFLIKEDLPTYVSLDPTYKPGASKVIKGTSYLHPDCNAAKDCPRYDVGVVVLNEPARMATYGALPEAGLVDTLEEGQRLTTVGYGATGFEIDGNPPPLTQPVYPDDRRKAKVRLLDTKRPDVGAMFVKTTGASLIKGQGETSCYGDSGGPLFLPDQRTIVSVTSYGIVPLCRGPGYYQRMDLPRVLKWVRSFP